ncbi:MAG TPA: Mov34/MPN/PAD-1 family protein, partial [Deinococcales bacterium]|nr:Mov34/MPN/PAD-1 family protein [Deinococcales bacterium]
RQYSTEPAGLVRALMNARQRGLELVAIYHSHPRGPATPSATDLALARWDVPYLIADPHGGEMRAFRLVGGASEVSIEVTD